ncbi:MAG: hypothetical protein [Wigfec virus K19_83]|nr:MAG: hypothetical protein [Wigfec virus K19_83]
MAKTWTIQTNYVDIETGLLLSRKEARTKYDIIKKTLTIKQYGKYNIKTKTYECRKGLRLF